MLLGIAIGAALSRHSSDRYNRPRYVTATGTPGPPQRDALNTAVAGAVTGDAPWALSALPDCFTQLFEAHGSLARVVTHEPARSRDVPPGTTLRSGDCTVRRSPSGEALDVRRADTALHVAHVASLAIDTSTEPAGARVSLVVRSARAAVLRVYRAVPGASVR